jgi:DNA-directed RNA polymerase specialized sigma subunit
MQCAMKEDLLKTLAQQNIQVSEIEKTILRLFFEEEKTLDEISGLLRLRRERVRQLKQKALRRLELK